MNNVSNGFNSDRLDRARILLQEGVDRELYPGGALWISRGGKTALSECCGYTDYTHTTPITETTLFDLASLTKPLATASAALILCQDGLITLGQCVPEFFPERNLQHLQNVTLYQLITHTSGLPAWRDLYTGTNSRDEVINNLFQIELENTPGTVYTYSCMGFIMLGLIIEAVSGTNLNTFTRTRLFEPMGMFDTGFIPDASKDSFAATNNSRLTEENLFGVVHDENANAMGGISGNAGLFSNVQDLATFCHSITLPCHSGKDLPLGSASLSLIFRKAISKKLGRQSVGWFMAGNDMLPTGDFVSKFVIGHSGFTGTALLIDPKYELCIVLLTNRVCCNDDGLAFRYLRRRLFNAILGAIV